MSYHKLIIVGNLGKDPEMRYTQNGTAVTTMNVATNRVYTDNTGAKVKETTWFRVSAWGKQGENCANYLKKGSMVLIEGEIHPDKETGNPRIFDRTDGSKGASYEVNAKTVHFLSKAEGNSNSEEDYEDQWAG